MSRRRESRDGTGSFGDLLAAVAAGRYGYGWRRFQLALPLCVLSLLFLNSLPIAKGPGDEGVDRSILMIVAHPDDEALWAGEFLAKHGRAAHVVVTSGRSLSPLSFGLDTARRRREFLAVAAARGFRGEYLLGNDWGLTDEDLENKVKRRIEALVCGQKWWKIVTHGPEGEYGHPMHHRVHDAVAAAVKRCCRNADKLHVFFPYRNSVEDPDWPEWSNEKVKALELYESQSEVIFKHFRHWQERIVPLKLYDVAKANHYCELKNLRNPKGGNFCRMGGTTAVEEFESSLEESNFLNEGTGC